MQNPNEAAQEPGTGLGKLPYAPLGIQQKELLRQDPRYKSTVLATVMSLVPGLGQVYVGYYQQGFINIVVIAGLIALLAHDGVQEYLVPFLAFFMVFYWFFNLVDAYRKATYYNQALIGLGALELPEGGQMPGMRGSLFGGLVMIVAGGIALSYTLFGLPLQWIERWWPLALVLMGVFLLYQSIVSRRKQRK
jgi:hypothetical protein